MAVERHPPGPVSRTNAGLRAGARPQTRRRRAKPMAAAAVASRQPGRWTRAAQRGHRSFRLHLAAEGKAARTVQGYTSAVRWFAAG